MNDRSNEALRIPIAWWYADGVTNEDKRVKSDNVAVIWAQYSEIAFIIPAAVVVGLLLGKLLDYWLHAHWMFLAGIIFGAVVGFIQMIRMVTKARE